MSARRWCAIVLLASSCRFGGGDGVSGDPLAINEPAASDHAHIDAASSGGAPPAPSMNTGGTMTAADAGRPMLDARAPETADASTPRGDATTRPPPPLTDTDGSASGSCTHLDVAVCDPVTNRGCDPPLQCIIDYASGTLAGYCAFSTPIDGGPFCVSTPVTESCPPRTTCVDGVCRSLCFCDDDCSQGECCAEPVGELGFKLCGSC